MRQAVILVGGQAMRMRPYTQDRPKAMVEIAGKAIIDHELEWLADNDVELAMISCGRVADMLQDHLGDGTRFGLEVDFAVESEPLGRGGGLKFAAGKLPDKQSRWFGINGDIITDFSIDDLVAQHSKLGVLATIALAPFSTNWGVADLEGDLIRGFIEKPKTDFWINAGVYCFEPEVVDMLPDKGDHENSTFPKLAKEGKLGSYRIDGYWRGIDTAKDIQEATVELEKM
ncbi:MAG: nucleotidyltransferase family protein [Acidimicrobiia bacterium]